MADPWKVVQYPLLVEKTISMIEKENKLVFIVRRGSSKKQIKWSIEKLLEVKIENINTLIDRKGRKKAIVKLAKEFSATDIATRFGML
ncbi:MAG: 50S ribosomal protein L23 [Candidatus Aenigmarchaeota archaeon]|nr:50S ribosomal protein L23 [Candidatus Aenigmarchaeota archaeon]